MDGNPTCIGAVFYNTAKSKHTITARKATPSINAETTIKFDRISALASG